MKKKAKGALESDAEEERYKVPEYKTVINISSKDQLNITLSKCGLQMLSNLGMVRNITYLFKWDSFTIKKFSVSLDDFLYR